MNRGVVLFDVGVGQVILKRKRLFLGLFQAESETGKFYVVFYIGSLFSQFVGLD